MPNLAKIELELRGPVRPDGTPDLRETDFMVTMVFPDDEVVRGRLTSDQLECLRDRCNAIISTWSC